MKKRAIIVTAWADRYHSPIDKLLLSAADKGGCEVETIGCNGYLPYCPYIDKPYPNITIRTLKLLAIRILSRTLLRPYHCYKCRKRARATYVGIKLRTAGKGLMNSISIARDAIILWLDKNSLAKELHESAKDGTLSCFLVGTRSEISDIHLTLQLAIFLSTRRYHIREVKSILDGSKPDLVILFNGRMLPYRIYVNETSAGSREISCCVHDRGFENSSFTIKMNEPAHSRKNLYQVLLKYSDWIEKGIDGENCKKWSKGFFEARVRGQNIDCAVPDYKTAEARSGLYNKNTNLYVIYLTTPDEVDPMSEEFELVVKQWDLVPRICRLLKSTNKLRDVRIVIRLHPNFYDRSGVELRNLDLKLRKLRANIKDIDDVFIDNRPWETSPNEIYSLSSCTIAMASSSILESEYFGTPSIAPSSHLYSLGSTYKYDFNNLLSENWKEYERNGLPFVPAKQDSINSRDKLYRFAFLFYYKDKFRFNTVKTKGLQEISHIDARLESSEDFSYIVENLFSDSESFVLRKLVNDGYIDNLISRSLR